MPRAAMADSSMNRGLLGTILRYHIIRRKDKSFKSDPRFRRLRVKHGHELLEALGG
jgi:hypothetical protein